MGLAQFSVGPAEPVEGTNKNYESEGRTFESFRARHFLLKSHRRSHATAGERARPFDARSTERGVAAGFVRTEAMPPDFLALALQRDSGRGAASLPAANTGEPLT